MSYLAIKKATETTDFIRGFDCEVPRNQKDARNDTFYKGFLVGSYVANQKTQGTTYWSEEER